MAKHGGHRNVTAYCTERTNDHEKDVGCGVDCRTVVEYSKFSAGI